MTPTIQHTQWKVQSFYPVSFTSRVIQLYFLSLMLKLLSTSVLVLGEVHLDRAHGLRGGGLHHALLGGLLLGAGGVSPRHLGRAALDPRHPRLAPGLQTGQARHTQARNRQPSIWVYTSSHIAHI